MGIPRADQAGLTPAVALASIGAGSGLTEESLKRLGARVRAARLAVGMTQAELAKAAGLKQPDVARIEKGEGNPTLSKLERLSAAISIPLHALLAP